MDSDENKYEEIEDNNEYSQNYSALNDLQESSDDDNTQHAKSNKAITDFISRQFAANERMQKIRDHPESEQAKPDNKNSPTNSPEHKHISDPARTEALYKSSLKKQEEEKKKKPPEPSTPRISEKSKQLANAKNERQINAIFSGLTRINQSQFDGLMRKFSIKSADLIENLKEYSKITNTENEEACDEDDKENVVYNGTKLKKLMISAANKEADSKLVKKVQPFVTATLANSISMISPKLKNGTSYSRKPQSSLTSKPTQQKQKPRDEKIDPVEKKQVRPKTAMKSGSKYLPDFYEHLEFNEEATPRYRTKHTYLAEKPKKPWK